MIAFLGENPLVLLFVVAAIGVLLGRVRVFGVSLGVAAVLFVGLGFGALDPSLELPELVYVFGLVLSVYTIGISSGPGFFRSLRRRGLRDNAFAFAVVSSMALLSIAAKHALHLGATHAAGLFAGVTTNTPALAAALQWLGASPSPDRARLLTEPVVACSVTYPMGVLGVLFAIAVVQRLFKIDYSDERVSQIEGIGRGPIESATMRVTRVEATNFPLEKLREKAALRVNFGRTMHAGVTVVATDDTRLALGDLLSVVGTQHALDAAAGLFGEISAERIDLDRRAVDYRRIFVSNAKITERPLSELDLPHRFGATLTRVRRGDVELLPDRETELELGDRVRVVAPPDRMDEVAHFLGDSYRALSEIDILTFGVGIALGLLLGAVPIPMPGGVPFRLGSAGGPLVVGLVLGRLGRTGRFVWTLPYSANLTLRQLGLVLFFAGIGTRSGYAFVHTLRHGGALGLFVAGALVTTGVSVAALIVGYKIWKIPMALLIGMLAGAQTQPAALTFATEQTKNDLPNVGYSTVYPLATIAKIVFAQLIVAFT